MKSLVLGSLFAAGATLGACTTSSTVEAHISATWAFETLVTESSSTPANCPPGFDTAVIVSQELAADLSPVGPPIEDVFNCDAMAGTTAGLPASWFEVWVEIRQGSETGPLYAQSGAKFVDVTTVDMGVDLPPIITNGGYFQLKWLLNGASTGNALTCAQAGALGGVEAVSTMVANSANAASDIFNCDEGVTVDIGAGEGFTAPLLAGSYTVSVDALNSAMAAIGTAPAITGTINSPEQTSAVVTNLGTVTIPIDGL